MVAVAAVPVAARASLVATILAGGETAAPEDASSRRRGAGGALRGLDRRDDRGSGVGDRCPAHPFRPRGTAPAAGVERVTTHFEVPNKRGPIRCRLKTSGNPFGILRMPPRIRLFLGNRRVAPTHPAIPGIWARSVTTASGAVFSPSSSRRRSERRSPAKSAVRKPTAAAGAMSLRMSLPM